MKKVGYVLMMMAMFIFAGCSGSDDDESPKIGVTTLDVKDIETNSATLMGKINPPTSLASDFEFGFELSREGAFQKDGTEKIQG